ncbi:da4a5a57-78ef-46ca-89d5-86ccefe3fb65 [Thermothielavioides terrestris]|uniref:Pentacotripeptide-repeat region of PRORP domain-containing protein n=2 Tax=Thermothielavioides terrestris TaxID=2587410 RepID=G2R9U4_THETT|nr:uncharacterized protein THITE_2120217 [Thermothielavioides terrestris NRRL 8126]AEO69585.1 hypothetical protein THITE_2120217 [Thermothielavioides terrestris NRRL 8126]SPQ26106.1 da4a5a57-78ef-46ca-89d5-86ccefe3fb65 [Thermothielavioides terrestris]
MFICRGCLRSLASLGAAPASSRLLNSLPNRTPGLLSSRRTYVAGEGIQIDVRSALAAADRSKPNDEAAPSKKGRSSGDRMLEDDGEQMEYEHAQALSDNEPGRRKYLRKLETTVKKHLEHFTDPYHIAQHVSRVLQKGSFDEALLMTRMASRNKKVEVSWNHLIDYQMKNHRLHAAVKLYNEMKKRGQIPNAKTYTIIFRGCAASIHPKLAVSEATRIYNFMIKHAALRPNTIHMNAVLEVCARAGDLESLFTVLATCNEGLRAPDAYTYTIVLNALRHDSEAAKKRGLGLVDAEVKREMQKNIHRGRAIWVDVIANWRSARTIIDADLVFAMARLLTTGDYQDNESVLDLLWQTMKIPRLDQPKAKLPPAAADSGRTLEDAAADASPPAPSAEEAPDTKDMSARDRKQLAQTRAQKTPLYAKPDSKTLAVALTALGNTRKTSHAVKYWDYFTKTLGVRPDAETYYCYQRTLAIGHASAQMAALVEAMPPEIVTSITFRRALRTCIDDNLNHDAFKHACRIFDLLVARQRYPDPLSVRLFLHAARANTRHFLPAPEPPKDATDAAAAAYAEEEEKKKEALGRQLVTAVDRVWEPLRILSGSLSYPEEPARSPAEELSRQRGDMQEIMATARRTISAIDKVVNNGLADRATTKLLRTRRAILQRQVERWILKLYPHGEPKDERASLKKDMQDAGFDRRDSDSSSARRAV